MVGAGVSVGAVQSKRAIDSFGCKVVPPLPLPRMLLITLDFTGEQGSDLDRFRALLLFALVGGGCRNELESKSPEIAAERRCRWPRFTVGGWSVMLIGSASDIDGSCGGGGEGFVCASEMSDMVLAREGRKKERRNEKERLWCV